jgi:hypothetical protein
MNSPGGPTRNEAVIGSEAAVAIASRTPACSACAEPTTMFSRRSREAAAGSSWDGAGSGISQGMGAGEDGTSSRREGTQRVAWTWRLQQNPRVKWSEFRARAGAVALRETATA